MWKGFRDFLLRGSVIDLAVAVVIGVAFGQLVASFVSDVLMPAIGAFGQGPDFSAIKVGPIAIGKFINATVNFLIVAAAIYFLVILPINRLRKTKAASPPSSRACGKRGGQTPAGYPGGAETKRLVSVPSVMPGA